MYQYAHAALLCELVHMDIHGHRYSYFEKYISNDINVLPEVERPKIFLGARARAPKNSYKIFRIREKKMNG